MKNIIGREEEKKQMKRFLNSDKAEFVALYGRRRVGKTFFVKEFFQHDFTFYFSGAENANKNQQLYNFTLAINEFSKQNYPPVKNWQDAFSQLKGYLQQVKTKKRKIIFIDELPWLDNHKSGFLSAFEYFWNTYASSDSYIFLITSGSATSWMINKIIKNRGGLHNRVTRQMLMKPFSLKETKLFLESKNINLPLNQIAECYMVFGGIPYYLEQLEKEYSLAQNIDRLLFRKDTSVLREEYKKIYHSLFRVRSKLFKLLITSE